MPYEPIRCPTCGSVKTIAAENKRFFCASCDGWFVWTDATHARQTEPPQEEIIEGMQKELRELRAMVNSSVSEPPPDDAPGQDLPFASISFPEVSSPDPFFLHNQAGSQTTIDSPTAKARRGDAVDDSGSRVFLFSALGVLVFAVILIAAYTRDAERRAPSEFQSTEYQTGNALQNRANGHRLIGMWSVTMVYDVEKAKRWWRKLLREQNIPVHEIETVIAKQITRYQTSTHPTLIKVHPSKLNTFIVESGSNVRVATIPSSVEWSIVAENEHEVTIEFNSKAQGVLRFVKRDTFVVECETLGVDDGLERMVYRRNP